MELNFVQSSEVFGKNTLAWETEFEATGDFNLHVERNKGGDILVYQRTAGSGYAIVEEFRGMDNKPAIDLDFTSVVYPKFVKIVSESQPTYATVTTDGEITEIKSQSKEIEVTSNGTTTVTPDAGFNYLNSVKVTTNVAGSGGGGGSENSMRYYRLDMTESTSTFVEFYATNIKADMGEGEIVIVGAGLIFAYDIPSTNWKAVAINVDTPTYSPTGLGIISFREQIESNGGSISNLTDVGLTEITEEEFYTL